jgi:hypothetical protein
MASMSARSFDPNKILFIEGLTEAESEALIAQLKGYMVQPATHAKHEPARSSQMHR